MGAAFSAYAAIKALVRRLPAIAAMAAGLALTAAGGSPDGACRQTVSQAQLPGVVGEMVGAAPVWLVDGGEQWRGADQPVKTLWVVLRAAGPVVIEGRQADGDGQLAFGRSDGDSARQLTIADGSRASVIPGDAPPEVMRDYAFFPSLVLYPSPGCWQFAVRAGDQEAVIVRDLRPASGQR